MNAGERLGESIHIGGVFASAKPYVVRTVLGSCIAVCLRDPISLVGGMNHFMLPSGSANSLIPTSFGVHAMELLINRCMGLGSDRNRLEAKIFGGAHVLRIKESSENVPAVNIKFAREFLQTEGIPVVSHDLGGYSAREVYFFTDTGRTVLRRLPATGIAEEEAAVFQRKQRILTPVVADDNVTLF